MKRKAIKPLLQAVLRGVQNRHIKSYEIYQPVLLSEGKESDAARDCENRWEAIYRAMQEHGAQSMVDLGSCEGYYVIKAARAGVPFCMGIDFDQRRTFTSTNQVILNDLPNAGFMIGEVSEGLLNAMPRFDTVVFMSVLHHIMYQNGLDHCRRLMQALHGKVGKFLIFEMGQSDEIKESWAKDMPDMGTDPHTWIADFLKSCGFRSIEIVGTTSSFLGEAERALFKAQP